MIIDLINKFWKRVDVRGPDDCWLWLGARNQGGYGTMPNGLPRHSRKTTFVIATHVSLAIDRRPRPSLRHVAMHHCDTPWCVNPNHLSWGTPAENTADMIGKFRAHWQGGAAAARGDPSSAAAEMDEAAALLGSARQPNAKLTEQQVREIRLSPLSMNAIAKRMGVSFQCVKDVRTRKTWTHIP